MPSMHLSAIARYPVKSCRGQALTTAAVEPWGLAGDRRWMIVDRTGEAVTAREVHRLVLVEPRLDDDGLTLTSPGVDPLHVATPIGVDAVGVSVFGTPVPALPAGDEAAAWVSELAGEPARLVYLHDPTARPTNPKRTRATDRVTFADGYPVLLTTEASLAALNDHIAEGPRHDEGPVSMTHFRPNLVVHGSEPWAEDDWREIAVGGTRFRVVKGCDRCAIPMIDPDTGVSGKEPIASLARHRRFDGSTWFGVNLVPDTDGMVGVGDEVTVISAVGPGEGPLR